MPLPVELAKSLIALKHPDYEKNIEMWKTNELFFQADEGVYENLKKFQWEDTTEGASEYTARQEEAVYINFPGLTSEKMNGVLFAHAPEPDFGTLGSLEDPTSNGAIIFDSADGVGTDARSWPMFWDDAMYMAPATKWRWMFVEAPPQRPQTVADERRGLRPYLVEYSPTIVPFWRTSRGQMDFVRVELEVLNYIRKDGKIEKVKDTHHYIMAREGFAEFGEELSGGGWWMVDSKGNPVMQGDAPMEGDWSMTGGEIPMFRLYYEQGRKTTSKQGLSDLVRLTRSYMNLYAAFVNDAWESGSRTQFFLGADPTAWDAVQKGSAGGGKRIPVPPPAGGGKVDVFDTGEITASGAIMSALDRTLELITRFIMRELMTAPDASGAAKQMEMLSGKSPRLAHMARNLEEAQREAIRFLEMRWGNANPTGTVDWPKSFDLRTVIEKIRDVLGAIAEAGASSPTLATNLIERVLQDSGMTPVGEDDDDTERLWEQAREEIRSSVARTAQGQSMMNDILGPNVGV